MEKVKPDVSDLSPRILQILTAHDSDIEVLKANSIELKKEIGGVSSKLDLFHAELTKVLNRPVLSFKDILSVAKDIGIFASLIVGAIIYIAGSHYDARLVKMEAMIEKAVQK